MSAAERARSNASIQATCCATLVDQWVRDGVTHAMVAPGSRSTPMALAIAARHELRLEVFHDERSAAFAAVGAGLATGRPALVLCTSGTAATHMHGAVVEAHLSGVPMLVLTADRPPELRDVGAPQTIDQTKLYGDAVRWFHDPGVPSVDSSHTWRSLARHAVAATLGTGRGPVHLNLPFREPLVGEVGGLPPAHLADLVVDVAEVQLGVLAEMLGHERGVLVAGRGVDDPAAVVALSEATGWPVLADSRSGCRGLPGVIATADAIVRDEAFAARHRPDVIVHLGEPPASKVVGQWAATCAGTQVRVTPNVAVVDPAHVISQHIVAPIGSWCRRLAAVAADTRANDWAAQWVASGTAAENAFAELLDAGAQLGEPTVARELSRFEGHVVVASSMPVRDLEWFGASDQRAVVWANRGANGIDGTVATAIGIAAATCSPVAVLCGDVALVHDSSSLTALARRDVDVRIVVIDNDGGGIFSFLPQATELTAVRFEQLFGTPHGTDLVALAAAHGLPASTVDDRGQLRAQLAESGSRLIRVVSERAANVEVHAQLHAAVASALRG